MICKDCGSKAREEQPYPSLHAHTIEFMCGNSVIESFDLEFMGWSDDCQMPKGNVDNDNL